MKREKSMKRMLIFALGVLVFTTIANPAWAFTAGRPTGVMVTVNDATGLTVDFDVSMTTTGTSPLGTIGSPVGFFGNLWSFQYTFFGSTVTNRYIWVNPSAPAMDFGDSNTIADTVLPLVAVGPPSVYTGSFMHTYPTSGTYTVTAGVCRFIGPTATVSSPAPGAGNLVTVGTATTITFLRYLLPTFTVPTTIVANFITPYAVGITNQLPGDGSVTVSQFAIDVPTVPTTGLVLLALALAAGGLFFLRR